jgi:hypothetical protein
MPDQLPSMLPLMLKSMKRRHMNGKANQGMERFETGKNHRQESPRSFGCNHTGKQEKENVYMDTEKNAQYVTNERCTNWFIPTPNLDSILLTLGNKIIRLP